MIIHFGCYFNVFLSTVLCVRIYHKHNAGLRHRLVTSKRGELSHLE